MNPNFPVNFRIAQWIDCLSEMTPGQQKEVIRDAFRARVIDRNERDELIEQLDLRDA